MADPQRRLDLSLEVIPLEAIYRDKYDESRHREFEAAFGPTEVDVSEEGLEKDADAAGGLPQPKLTPPSQSVSEVVREKSGGDSAVRKGVDTVLRTLTGSGVDEIEQAINAGTLDEKVGMKLADPAGNVAEALLRKASKDAGVPEELADKVVGTVAALSTILLPPGGSGGKAAKKAADAAALAKRGKGMKAGATASNMARVEAPVEVKAVMKNIETATAERMTPGVQSHAETVAKSQAVSLEQAMTLDVAKFDDLAHVRTAVRDHYQSAARQLEDVAKRVVAGDQAAIGEYAATYMVASQLAENQLLLGTAAGRGLEAGKIMSEAGRAPISMEMIQQMAGSAGQGMTPEQVMIHARRMLTRTAEERRKILASSPGLLRRGVDALEELWISSLLTNPVTHAANISSNALAALWAPGERFLAATLDNPFNRTVYFSEPVAMLRGTIEGFADGLRIVGQQLKEERKLLKGQVPELLVGTGKIETGPAISSQAFQLDPKTTGGAAIDYLGALFRTTFRALSTEDALFKSVARQQQKRALAAAEASSQGLRGKEHAAAVRDLMDDPAIIVAAEDFSRAQTFTRELDEMGRIGQIGAGARMMFDAFPAGRAVLPFIRTPTNIFHYASERTPILNLFTGTVREALRGSGRSAAQARGKVAGGVMVAAGITMYGMRPIDPDNPTAYMTWVTGHGPTNPTRRAELMAMGWRPFSVWNPAAGEYVSYNRLDPLGMVLGTVASTYEIVGQIPEAGGAELGMAGVKAAADAMLSKTYMEGISEFFGAMQGNTGDINRFFESLARTGVPAGVRQLVRIQDPFRREVDGLFDHWRAGLPGYDGPEEVNLWGDPIMYSGGLGPDIVSPLYTSKYDPDDVTQWLVNNRVNISKAPEAVAGTPPPGVQLEPETGKEGVRLDKWTRARLGVLRGKGGDAPVDEETGDLGPLTGQPPLKEVVRNIINGPGTDGPGGSKADFIRTAVNQRTQQAINQLRREYPELSEEMDNRIQERIRKKIPGLGVGP